MKKLLFIFVPFLFLFACNNENQSEINEISEDNALLAKDVKIIDRITLKNDDNPDWVLSFDNEVFFKNIFEKIFSGEFTDCYKHIRKLSDTSKYSAEDVKERMVSIYHNETDKEDAQPDLSELKEILFREEWNFDSEKLVFEKKIMGWSPIRVYIASNDTEDTRFKMVMCIHNDKEFEKVNKIAEDYEYIYDFNDKYLEKTGLDKDGFYNFLLQNIKDGKIKTYDPIYLVDKSKREFTLEQLKNFAGISLDPDDFAEEVNQIIFVEDWYFDDKTFNIAKEVKGLGFIAERYNNNERDDKILFFIFFDN